MMKTKLFSLAIIVCSLFSFSQRLDVAFGIGGRLDVPEINKFGGFFLQPDGKFLVSGSTIDNKGIIARFYPSGVYDNTFGTNGKLILDDATSLIRPTVINDGGIIVFANSDNTSNLRFRKIRTDGTIDQTYTQPFALHPWFQPGTNGNSRFVIFPDGRIVYAYWYRFYWNPGPGGKDHHWIASIKADGTNDSSTMLYEVDLYSSSDLYMQNLALDKQNNDVYWIDRKNSYKLYKYVKGQSSYLYTPTATLSPDAPNTSLLGGLKYIAGSIYYRGQIPAGPTKVTFSNKFIPSTKQWEANEIVQDEIFYNLDITAQSDGKIVQLNRGGSSSNMIQFARIKTDHIADSSFGTVGKFSLNPGVGTIEEGVSEYDPITDRIYAVLVGASEYAIIRINQNLPLSTADENKNNLKLYPNPVKNTIVFSKEIKSAEIYSLDGKRVFNNIEGKSADLSKLTKGIYIIRGTDKEGQSFSEKIVKE